MATFSIWEGEDCGISLIRGEGPPRFADGRLIDPHAVRVKVFQAATWPEACQVECDYYGWGKYDPGENTWEEIGPDEP